MGANTHASLSYCDTLNILINCESNGFLSNIITKLNTFILHVMLVSLLISTSISWDTNNLWWHYQPLRATVLIAIVRSTFGTNLMMLSFRYTQNVEW